jgi:hypothetical protein
LADGARCFSAGPSPATDHSLLATRQEIAMQRLLIWIVGIIVFIWILGLVFKVFKLAIIATIVLVVLYFFGIIGNKRR